jgi:hypothetical protein
MYRMFSVLTVTLVLSTGWWGELVRATAEALGFETSTTQQAPPPSPPSSNITTTDTGCSMDPLGGCSKG